MFHPLWTLQNEDVFLLYIDVANALWEEKSGKRVSILKDFRFFREDGKIWYIKQLYKPKVSKSIKTGAINSKNVYAQHILLSTSVK